jgi:hypothetical protein
MRAADIAARLWEEAVLLKSPVTWLSAYLQRGDGAGLIG